MNISSKNPVIEYLLAGCTFGLYFIYWLYRITNQINLLTKSKGIPNRLLLIFLVVIIASFYITLGVLAIVVDPRPEHITHCTVIFMGTFYLFFAYCGSEIARAIGDLQKNYSVDKRCSSFVCTILVFGGLFLIVPYLQYHFNSVINKKNHNNDPVDSQ